MNQDLIDLKVQTIAQLNSKMNNSNSVHLSSSTNQQFREPIQIKNEIDEIFEKIEADLSPQSGHFSNEDRAKIFSMALDKFLSQIKNESSGDLIKSWNSVVIEYHRNAYWGFKPNASAPKRELKEDQKIHRELFSYIWAFIQSMIVLKTAVYYFGLEFAEQKDPLNLFFLLAAIGTSFGSLIFFAYRKTRATSKDSNQFIGEKDKSSD